MSVLVWDIRKEKEMAFFVFGCIGNTMGMGRIRIWVDIYVIFPN